MFKMNLIKLADTLIVHLFEKSVKYNERSTNKIKKR